MRASRMFRKPDGLRNRRHLLVIGAPRSGTTLLATMIGRHTEVGMVNEDVTGRGLRKILGRPITGNKLCVPNQIQLERRNFWGAQVLKKIGILSDAPKSRYSIKDYLELPNVRVIGIIRDGNDSISSMMLRGGSGLKKAVRRWTRAIETLTALHRDHKDRFLVVAFEDLVLAPEQTLRKICRFIDVEFQPRMLDGHEHNPYYPEPRLHEEKARGGRKENSGWRLEDEVPAAFQKYRELSLIARQDGLADGPSARAQSTGATWK